MACRKFSPLLLLLAFSSLLLNVHASPPEPIVKCKSGNAHCTVTNAYGAFPDRTTCRAAAVAFPGTEAELLATVSAAAAKNQHVKVVTQYGHSIPKLSCPGGPSSSGLVISTQKLNRVVAVNSKSKRMTFEAGITLGRLIAAAAAEGLALPYSPYWHGITLGGLLATASHGSSFFGKGAAVHEYVVGMRLVVPKGASATVIELGEDDPDLLAAKVSLGVLGVVSQVKSLNPRHRETIGINNLRSLFYQVTLQLQPMFKRSITNRVQRDENFEKTVSSFAATTEFGDITWYPGQGKVVYRDDVRLPLTARGKGKYDLQFLQPQLSVLSAAYRKSGPVLKNVNRTLVASSALSSCRRAAGGDRERGWALYSRKYPGQHWNRDRRGTEERRERPR